MCLNQVAMVATVAKDPLVRFTSTGKRVADFAVSVRRQYVPKDVTQSAEDLFRVRCWNENAELISQQGAKGLLVSVAGRLETDRFRETSLGLPDAVIIVADRITILEPPTESTEEYDELDPTQPLNRSIGCSKQPRQP